MKKLYIILLCINLFGCYSIQPIKNDCSNSYINRYINNPKLISSIITLANIEAIKNKVYSVSQANNVLYMIKGLLEKDGITYVDFYTSISPIISKLNYIQEILIISNEFIMISNTNIVINKCDKDILLSLINNLININKMTIKG